jgi:two-component system sensor histidine kinase HydH
MAGISSEFPTALPSRSRVERRGRRLYDTPVRTIFDEIKSYVGFTQRDAEHLKDLAEVVQPALPRVVDRFYAEISRHPAAKRVFSGEEQLTRLRGALRDWIATLFSGVYDEKYVDQRSRIGHTHVRVGLPQHYMFGAIEVIWQELQAIVRAANPPAMDEKLAALHKLLTIETVIMLESYRSSYAERVRTVEHEAIQDRLSRAEQLAEVGQLAASLAHEIKNPLAGISGAIQVLRDEMKANDPRRAVLEETLRQVMRLDGTVKDLLTYARPAKPQFGPCRFDQVIRRVTTLLSSEGTARGVRFLNEENTDLAPIEADEHQLEQLLVNLLINALHASRKGDTVRLRVLSDGEDLVLVVEDEGQGMDAATARRAFEPFFTTKTRGTGLGLSICQRIADAHGGSISMNSERGRGTAVEVRLPRRQVRPDPERRA